jgi:hypothetical protein
MNNHRVLALLSDEDGHILDLNGAGAAVTDAAIRSTLAHMPRLQFVDLRGCSLSAGTLRKLGSHCPAVQVLRIGKSSSSNGREAVGQNCFNCRGAADVEEAMCDAVCGLVPALNERSDERAAAAAAESWEEAASGWGDALADLRLFGVGRLAALQCLAWREAPGEVVAYCRERCPGMLLNPDALHVEAGGAAAECDPFFDFAGLLLRGAWGEHVLCAEKEGGSKA